MPDTNGKLTMKTTSMMGSGKAKDNREGLGSASSLKKGAAYLRDSFKSPAAKAPIRTGGDR